MSNGDVNILLRLDGIDGESAVKGHEKEIAVLSYEQVVEVTVVLSGGGGGATAGKSKFTGLRFRKNVDAASIPMLVACTAGQHLKEARFTFRRSASAFDFYTVTLEDVLLTDIAQRAGTGAQYPLSFETMNAGSAHDGILDEVTLNFSRIRWVYRTERPDGSTGATTSGGWDVRANKKL